MSIWLMLCEQALYHITQLNLLFCLILIYQFLATVIDKIIDDRNVL